MRTEDLRLAALVGLALWVPRPALAGDADRDGISNRLDACRHEAEVHNGYLDHDGCPDELATVEVVVVDLEGDPVTDAWVYVGGRPHSPDAQGRVVFADRMPETAFRARAGSPVHQERDTGARTLVQGVNRLVITLDWRFVPLRISTRSADGAPVDANLRFDGPGNVESQGTGASGVTEVPLRPGVWQVQVQADRHETWRRSVEVAPGTEAMALDVALVREGARASIEEVVGGAQVPFDDGSAVLGDAWGALVDDIGAALRAHPHARVAVHRGGPDALGEARAQAVVDRLVAGGVDGDRLALRSDDGSDDGRVTLSLLPVPEPDVEGHIGFDEGSWSLDAAARDRIARIAEVLAAHPHHRIAVTGHAHASDLQAAKADAWTLGWERASAVGDALVAAGVASDRVVRATRADAEPVANVGGPNRRVTVTLLPPGDLDATVRFADGVATLPDDAAAVLDRVARRLLAAPDRRVDVRGRRARGEPAALSQDRAGAVVDALTSRGIDAGRLRVVDLGLDATTPDTRDGARSVTLGFARPRPLQASVHFPADADDVPTDAGAVLDSVRRAWSDRPSATLEVVGSSGEADTDPQIGLRRAEAIRSALVDAGIPATRVVAVDAAPVEGAGRVAVRFAAPVVEAGSAADPEG